VSLARRLTLFFAGLAVLVAGAIGVLSYAATDRAINAELQANVHDAAVSLLSGETLDGLGPTEQAGDDDAQGGQDADRRGGPDGTSAAGDQPAPGRRATSLLAQTLDIHGTASGIDGRAALLPVDAVDKQLAAAGDDHGERYRVAGVNGVRYLVITHSKGYQRGGGAVMVGRSLADRDGVLTRLAGSVVLVALGVAVVAALAGALLARRLTRRLVRLTAAVEEVTATGRLDVPVPAEGRDEVGRLGTAFDSMLGRLARSQDDQQRLVADAGHELRTPLTSLRTNVSLLRRLDELSPGERQAVLDDLGSETRELTALVNELVELATQRRAEEEETDVDLAVTAERVADRGRRRTGREVRVDADPVGAVVRGRAGALERALSNLVDNALKFDEGGSEPVEIALHAGLVEVRDRGPGIPEDEIDRIFDRFHRATAVRSLPGSGLGLSIVKDVAESHDGHVFAENRPGGGAVIGFTLGARRLQTRSNPG